MIKYSSIFCSLILLTFVDIKVDYAQTIMDSVQTGKDSVYLSKYIIDFRIIKEADSNRTFILVSDDRYFLAERNGIIRCFELSGEEKWTTEIQGSIYCSPVRDGDLLALTTEEGDLYSINSNNGNVLQVIGIGESLISDLVTIPTNFRNEPGTGVVLASESGAVYCYDLYTLELNWMCNEVKSTINSEIFFQSDRIFFLTDDSFIVCIDSRTGLLTWRWDAIKITSGFHPVTSTSAIYFIANEQLIAIDLLSGLTNWKHSKSKSLNLLGIDREERFVYTLTRNSEIRKIEIKKGKIISEIKTEAGYESVNKPILFDDMIFVKADKYSLYVISLKSGKFRLILTDTDEIIDYVTKDGRKFFLVNNAGKVYSFKVLLPAED